MSPTQIFDRNSESPIGRMVNPFHYPKAVHRRTRTPPAYKDYKFFKPELQLEFSGQCVYCRALDRIKGQEAFGVDHYRPKKLFPHLATEYLNLFYACNRCNSYKGSFWPSPAQARDKTFVPNPCEHVMFDHLRYRGGTVMGASTSGDFTIDLLDLNDPLALEWRSAFIKTLELIGTQIEETKVTIGEAKRIRDRAETASDKAKAARELAHAEQNLQQLGEMVKGLLG